MNEREDLKYVTDIKPDADAEFAKFEGRYFSTPKKMGAQTAEANINAGTVVNNGANFRRHGVAIQHYAETKLFQAFVDKVLQAVVIDVKNIA